LNLCRYNEGVGARLNTLEAYVAKGGSARDDGGTAGQGAAGAGPSSPSNDPRRNSTMW
jgi:hypothetical protein